MEKNSILTDTNGGSPSLQNNHTQHNFKNHLRKELTTVLAAVLVTEPFTSKYPEY